MSLTIIMLTRLNCVVPFSGLKTVLMKAGHRRIHFWAFSLLTVRRFIAVSYVGHYNMKQQQREFRETSSGDFI
jgi:hypothetical protein